MDLEVLVNTGACLWIRAHGASGALMSHYVRLVSNGALPKLIRVHAGSTANLSPGGIKKNQNLLKLTGTAAIVHPHLRGVVFLLQKWGLDELLHQPDAGDDDSDVLRITQVVAHYSGRIRRVVGGQTHIPAQEHSHTNLYSDLLGPTQCSWGAAK